MQVDCTATTERKLSVSALSGADVPVLVRCRPKGGALLTRLADRLEMDASEATIMRAKHDKYMHLVDIWVLSYSDSFLRGNLLRSQCHNGMHRGKRGRHCQGESNIPFFLTFLSDRQLHCLSSRRISRAEKIAYSPPLGMAPRGAIPHRKPLGTWPRDAEHQLTATATSCAARQSSPKTWKT